MGADAVRSGHAGLLIRRQKSDRERLRELRTSREVKSELAWNTWPNRLVLRRSLHSENETNDLLKSGPALAGPAGPATPPLNVNN